MDVVLFVGYRDKNFRLNFVQNIAIDMIISAALISHRQTMMIFETYNYINKSTQKINPYLNPNLQSNSPKMNFLWRWGRQYQKCKDHNQQVILVCYQQKCQSDRLLCKDCQHKHQKHVMTNYQEYKQMFSPIEKHIKLRQNLQHVINQYKKTAVEQLEKLFKDMHSKIFNVVDNKYCSNKFLEIQKLYKNQGDFIPLVCQCKQNPPDDIYRQVQSLLLERQKSVLKVINKLQVSFDVKAFINQKMEQYPFNHRESRIKRILPFNCNLKLKFKASENQFLSKKMYSVNIRGPILLYVESYKGRHFGGYSSMMFPKYEQDYSSQSRNIQTFLFSLDHNEKLPLKEQYKKFAIKGGTHFGFGQGDLLISDECHKGNISWAQIGRTYKEPSNVKGPLNEYLGGAAFFRVIQYEIYSVQVMSRK